MNATSHDEQGPWRGERGSTQVGGIFITASTTSGLAALAFTGVNVAWMVIAACTLTAAGAAILRLAPRRER